MLSLNCHFFKRRARTEYFRRSPATTWLLRIIKTLSLIALGVVLAIFIMLLSQPAHADSADDSVSTNSISEVSPSRPAEKSLNEQVKPDKSSQGSIPQKAHAQLTKSATYVALQLIIGCTLLLLALINQFVFSRRLKLRIL